MKSNRQLKAYAKKRVRNRLWHSIVVCFIISILITGGFKYNTASNIITTNNIIPLSLNFKTSNNLDIITGMSKNITHNEIISNIANYKPTRGVLSAVFNQITTTGSIIMGILNAINIFIFNNSISNFITILLGTIIYILLFIFVINILIVGKNRFFIEHNNYNKVNIDKLLFIYRVKKTKNIAYIMFTKYLYQLLWNLTIIGGIIKYYEYMMIPYILAENPNISKKDCFKLSKEMTNNYKLQLLKLDLSFIGWYLLGCITLNVSNIFYFNPYKETIYSKIYLELRSINLKDNKEIFQDKYLNVDKILTMYPNELYFIEEYKRRKWLKLDYRKDYSISSLILLFFTFSCLGWLWEVLLYLFTIGTFVNRGAFLGPWLPIYGAGGVVILTLLKNYREKPLELFTYSLIICGTIEYLTAWFLEVFRHMKWWDYSGFFLNIDGKICLEGLLFFGLGSCIFTYILAPIFDNLYKKINKKLQIIIIIILVSLFIIDFIYSTIYPNIGNGITDNFAMFKDIIINIT